MAEGKRVRQPTDIEPAELRRATDDLRALIDQQLPQMFSMVDDDWPGVAHGFLARSGQLLESLTVLVEKGHEGEAQMLLRIIYEHVTVFCWLAINPKPHLVRWREWANAAQLTVHREAKIFFGLSVLDPATVAEYEKAEKRIPLAQLAKQVDDHWSEQSTAFQKYDPKASDQKNALTFIGLYPTLYRKTSNLIHAYLTSPDRFASLPLTGHVNVQSTEQHTESADYPGFSIALVGFMLIAFGHRFGWPEEGVTRGIVDKLSYYDD
jgi:Family of unknown function (DUF5677)